MTKAVDERVAQTLRADILAMHAYHVADASGMVKLDAMENPYPLPAELIDAWLQSLRGVALNRYPDPKAQAVGERLRVLMNLGQDQALLLGNGSDEIIQLLCMAAVGPRPVVLSPTPGFVMYEMIARHCRMQFVGVALDAQFQLREQAMLEAIAKTQPALVFLSYPNNPSGNLFDTTAMAHIIEACPGLVVVDEAYYIFARQHVLAWQDRYPQLLVMRTLSKLGLAGLRLGLLIGAPSWLHEFDKIRLPYNINVLTQTTAAFVLDHWQQLRAQIQRIVAQRQQLYDALRNMVELTAYPSEANFILFRTQPDRAATLFNTLKSHKVLVKRMPNEGLLRDCLRVTVGTQTENEQFLSILRQAI